MDFIYYIKIFTTGKWDFLSV